MTEQLFWLEVEPAGDGVRTFVLSLDGDRPAVVRPGGFTSCRSCWYQEWLRACLLYAHRNRRPA